MRRIVWTVVAVAALAAAPVGFADVKVRVAEPSAGVTSGDVLLYTANAVDFGADKTGRRDSTDAIKAALEAVDKERGGTVFLPAGRYRVNGRLDVRGGCTLRGEWMNPTAGGLGKGTILMAFAGRGEEKPDGECFVTVHSGGCLRDLSVWYPNQSASDPVPYPATIRGHGHTTVYNVTLYNSWCGFWNNDCSSMLIRRMYGTVLKLGIHGAYAFDIPRIEHVRFDPMFWAQSGLPGSPAGASLGKLCDFLDRNLTCVQGGEQDWGYWWDLEFDHCWKGLFLTAIPSDDRKKLVPGNIAAGNVRIRHAKVGVYVENAGYPGFMLTYGDISASSCPLFFAARPDYSAFEAEGLKPSYQRNSSLVVTGVRFSGGQYSVGSKKIGPYGINLADCTFSGYRNAAIRSESGSVTASRCHFKGKGPNAFELGTNVVQVMLQGNDYAGGSAIKDWAAGDPRVFRDEADKSMPAAVKYEFDHDPKGRPVGNRVWNVCDSGAVRGTLDALPTEDSTAAFQRALDLAATAKGGTVYVPAGIYRIEGSLYVAPGVELRGSFEGAHYGNSTSAGTQLWVYGNKDQADGMPLVRLSRGSGFRGFTVFYPEQGWTDQPDGDERARVKKYPPTVRTASNCWVRDCTIVCCWEAIDAMTVRSDNLEIADVTGASLDTTLHLGHGATGGTVRNLHFNYSNWTHQGKFPNRPRGGEGNPKLDEYTTRCVKGLVLGDVRNFDFFSCFNIIVAEQIVLEKDPFTGGSFRGKMWGVAFDAAHDGVVGRANCDATIALVASMGVFNQHGGGHYAVTDPAFRGSIVFSNADVWSGTSRIADVSGGRVSFLQLLSWCCLGTDCHSGGTLDVIGCTYVGDHIGANDKRPCIAYDAGAKGTVTGTVECNRRLSIVIDPGAKVKAGVNGFRK